MADSTPRSPPSPSTATAPRECDGVIVESGEAQQDRAGHRARTEIGDDVGIGGVGTDPIDEHGPGELVKEQGIAACGPTARRRETGVWSGTESGLEQPGDGRLGERSGLEGHSAGLTRQLRHEGILT